MTDFSRIGSEQRRFLAFSTGWALGCMTIALLGGGLLVAVPLVDAFGEVAAFGTTRIDNAFLTEDFWVPVVFGLIGLGVALAVGIHWALGKHRAIALHEHGLAFYHGKQVTAVVPWASVVALTRAQKYDLRQRASQVTYTLHTREKATHSFSGTIAKADDLVAACQQHIDATLGPAYEALLRDGKRAGFGVMALDTTAVYVHGYAVPWHEVRGVQASATAIVVQRKTISTDAPQAVALERVPNWWIFLRLAGRFVR